MYRVTKLQTPADPCRPCRNLQTPAGLNRPQQIPTDLSRLLRTPADLSRPCTPLQTSVDFYKPLQTPGDLCVRVRTCSSRLLTIS